MRQSVKIVQQYGGVAEWLKALLSKSSVPSNRDREFESRLLRQKFELKRTDLF